MDSQKNQKNNFKVVTQVDDFGRKKFRLQEEDSNNQEQQGQNKFMDTGRYASTLIGRDEKIDTDKFLGKIEGTKKKKKTQVFYCQVCKLGFKCDLAYITHINSASHNRKLGMNMKVEAVSVETVAEKLARMAAQKNKSKYEIEMQKKFGKNWEKDLNREQQDDDGLNLKKKKKIGPAKAKSESQQQQSENEEEQNVADEQNNEQQQQSEDEDEKMMRQLGLPTSCAYKKKY